MDDKKLKMAGLSAEESVLVIRNETAIDEFFNNPRATQRYGGTCFDYVQTWRTDYGLSNEDLPEELESACNKLDQLLARWPHRSTLRGIRP